MQNYTTCLETSYHRYSKHVLYIPEKETVQFGLSNVSDHNKFAQNYKTLTDEQKKCLMVENENGSYKKKKKMKMVTCNIHAIL